MVETSAISPQADIEVRHGSRYDLVLNRSAARQDLVQDLAVRLTDGVPNDWSPFKIHVSPSAVGKIHYIDNVDNPHFFLKTRYNLRRFFEHGRSNAHFGEKMIRVMNASASVVNEISISPRIKEVLGSQEALRLALQHGFERMEFIEPLVAMVDRQTGEKASVYEFIDGVSRPRNIYADLRDQDEIALWEKLDSLMGSIGSLLERGEIAVNDLRSEQCIISRDKKTVYLLDAEQYYRK